MTTTRKHPRTLHEAFPRSADYASAIERHRTASAYPVAWWLCMAAITIVAFAVVFLQS